MPNSSQGEEHRLDAIQETIANSGQDAEGSEQRTMLRLLTEATESFAEANKSRSDEYKMLVQRISTIEANMENVCRDMRSLCKVVRDGNGQPSIVQRLANVEVYVQSNLSDIAEVKHHANSIIAAKALSKSQVIAGLSGMIVTALLSSLALIATLMKG